MGILDLRNTIATRVGGVLAAHTGCRDPDRFALFDLGRDSLMDAVSKTAGRFRCTNYDPDHMSRTQGPGVHKFLLCKEPFEVDVLLNLPKLEAHAKAGVTAALKNLVGLNGDKNYLPHHRLGGSALGGDCYAGLKPLKRLAEFFLDEANRRIGRPSYRAFERVAQVVNAAHGGDVEGKWVGNDTTWRMALDLNRILLYGDAAGCMHDEPQRKVFSLTDAIIAGERNGPLAPEPVPLGIVTFASNSVHADATHLALMGFDQERVPLVREASRSMRWRLADSALPTEVCDAGRRLDLDELAGMSDLKFRPPDGWARCVRPRNGAPRHLSASVGRQTTMMVRPRIDDLGSDRARRLIPNLVQGQGFEKSCLHVHALRATRDPEGAADRLACGGMRRGTGGALLKAEHASPVRDR